MKKTEKCLEDILEEEQKLQGSLKGASLEAQTGTNKAFGGASNWERQTISKVTGRCEGIITLLDAIADAAK